MKKYLLFASAIIAFASCTNDSFTGGEEEGRLAKGDKTITFGFDVPNATRAESTGATAAAKLSNQFVVYAEKNESGAAAPTTGNLVIQNYQVKWAADSENSTTSNTEGWEYVGFASAFPSQVTPVSTETQTIKYWDYSASSYTFTAISALPADLTGGKMSIAKTTAATASGATKYDKGYTVTISNATADFSKLYFADRVEIAPSNGTNRYADNTYGGNVTFRFRNAMSQVRVGMYETIDGYAISAVKFYENDGTTEQTNASSEKAFGAIVPNIPATGFTGTLTVTYADDNTDIENQPIVTTARTGNTTETNLVLGKNIQTLSTSNLLGTTSTNPTWDTAGGTYTSVFPQASNTTAMVLKVDYTLYNATTHETIEVKGATATVPAAYVAWKPNVKYTYLFKISRDTNGSSGQGVVGLYPITFDAVVVEAEDGIQETITTVAEPSITTYAKGAIVTANDEYTAGSNIYAIVENGTALTVGTNANLYTVTIEAGAAQTINEASVANALANGAAGYDEGTVLAADTELDGYYTESGGTYTACTAGDKADGSTTYYRPAKVVTDANGKKMTVANATGLTAVTEIAATDAPDGNAITVNGAKFTPAAAGIYAFEYINGTDKYYKVIKVVAAP